MHVALLANLKKNAPTWPGMTPDQWDDLDSQETIEAIMHALRAGGHKVTFLEGDISLYDSLRQVKPDICFNICEGHFGDSRESQVPALLEMLRIPYTGSRVLTLALALDKPMTKRVLAYHGLPTPAFQVFERANEPLDPDMHFPMFVKPSREGTGMGVSAESIVRDEAELRVQLERQLARYKQPILAEQYHRRAGGDGGDHRQPDGAGGHARAGGRGCAARPARALLFPAAGGECRCLPGRGRGRLHQPDEDRAGPRLVLSVPGAAACRKGGGAGVAGGGGVRVTGCMDVARIDFRLEADDHEKPYILEVNPLPGLNPGYSDLCVEAQAAGWTYEELINRILDEAIKRHGL